MRVWSSCALLWAAGCGQDSPYAWNSFGIGPNDGGCVAQVGFSDPAAPADLDVTCADGACACVADGEEVGAFTDDAFCDDWQRAMDGSAGRQDAMIAVAVGSCGL